MIKTEIAYNEGYNLALADLKNKIPEIEKKIIEEIEKLTWYRNDEGVTEIEQGKWYVKLEEIKNLTS